MVTKKTRKQKAGEALADSILEMVHMMYQLNTARGFLKALIDRLQESAKEFEGK